VADAAYGDGSEDYYFDSAVQETYADDGSLPSDVVEQYLNIE